MQSSFTDRSRPSLPRVPLVPDSVLKAHNVYLELDTRFRRAARLLQAFWLADNAIPSGAHVRVEPDAVTTSDLGSLLSPDAARMGKNFITPAIHRVVRRELVMREEGAAIDEDRLFGNALSSMPLVFNLFGPMALDLGLGTAVFRRLLPGFVKSVEGFVFEHSPGRREPRFLNDGTAFDLAVKVVTPEGESGSIFVEVKYSEDMSGPVARHRDRYDEASRQVRLYKDPDCIILRSLGLEQLWREHLLAQLAVDEGVTSRALFLAVAPRLNRRVQSAFRVYEKSLLDEDDRDEKRVEFRYLTIETFIDALSVVGATDIARTLWARYADFERIYHASLPELDDRSQDEDSRLSVVLAERPQPLLATEVSSAQSREGGAKVKPIRECGARRDGLVMTVDSLLTVADQVQLLVNALDSGTDHRPVVKLFAPDAAATWLISEVDPDDPDRLFGLCDLGLGFPELGYVSLAEITSVKGRLGLPVERDLHFVADKPLSSYAEEARAKGRIVA